MTAFDELDTKTIDRLKRHAQEAQATPLPFLNYEGSVWRIGGEQVTDSEWVVATDMCAVGWTLFHDNQIAGELYVSALGNEKPPRPKTHTDKSLWKVSAGGWRSDPWSLQYSLPLRNEISGQIVLFKASKSAAKAAVGKLLEDFADKRRRPRVVLTSTTVRRNGRDEIDPVFEIIEVRRRRRALAGCHCRKE
ncbi:hypothetical protein IVA95_15490 [Bradyrhizobium sp. 157]|uniref:hypothetical protein n=1 Tax=Bradyrhizobium sp. 157 TaxID=2782631 RepID=UPI001FFAFC44|nr:hypothetical protein [Bradyrhizobium sp. 157]MCK1638966.1 hypothetical protein [Bradyrhizobium sp. 157]